MNVHKFIEKQKVLTQLFHPYHLILDNDKKKKKYQPTNSLGLILHKSRLRYGKCITGEDSMILHTLKLYKNVLVVDLAPYLNVRAGGLDGKTEQ